MEQSGLHEFAVLLPAIGSDSFGRPQLGTAIEIPARWELSQALSANTQQKTKPSVGIVFVDRVLPMGSVLWRGRLCNWVPATVEGLYEVTANETIPDIKARETEYTVNVANFKKSLPS